MSELATEISGSTELVSTVEFLGSDFAARKKALEQVEAFRRQAKEAFADSVACKIGRTVLMTFRPSSVHDKKYKHSFPVYSLSDDERVPLEKEVTILNVDAEQFYATVGSDEELDGYNRTYSVRLNNILSMVEIDDPEDSQPQLEVSNAVLEQRAILDSSAYWGIDHGSLIEGTP